MVFSMIFSSITLKNAKLFNLMLCTGHFPEIWNEGITTPIYKNGD